MANNRVVSNFIWRFLERIGAQGVTFLVSIVLARLLDPNVYGVIGLVTVFTTILEVFVSSGIGTALVQKKNADDVDFSTVFYFNICTSVILYILLFALAPVIADFYKNGKLTSLIRVLSLTIIVSGVKNVQHAYVSRHMLFRKFFFATLGGTLGAAVVGIWMAYRGFGVWALVAQSLFNHVVDTIILWAIVPWRPQKVFSFSKLKTLYSFGWKLLVSSLIDRVYKELRALIIGKLYTSSDLAYYNRGEQFPRIVVQNLNTSIDSILLPVMSRSQDNKDQIRALTRRAIKLSTYLIMPMMLGLAVCAESVVRIVLTEKWLPCVFYMRIFCFTYAFYPIHTANLNAIKAMGRSDLFLVLETVKKVIGLGVLVATMFISVEVMALSAIGMSIVSQIINSWPNRKLLNYHYGDQVKDLMPQILLSCVMGALVYCVQYVGFNDWLTLVIQVLLGVTIYIVGSKLFHMDSYDYLLSMIKNFRRKYTKKA